MDKLRNFGKRLMYGNPNKADWTPDDLPKTEPKRYFAVAKQYLGRMVSINLLYVVCMLPVIAWIFMNAMIGLFTDPDVFNDYFFTFMLILTPLMILEGPILAGVSYVCNRWVRDEHVFMFSDFKDAVKENWKQALALQAFSMLIYFLSTVSLRIYATFTDNQWLMVLGFSVLFLVISAVAMMNNFMIPMCVRYRMRVKDIIRNSFLLAVVRLPKAVVMTLLLLVPYLLMAFIPQAVYFVVLFFIIIGFGWKHFTRAYFAQGVFNVYMKPEDVEDEEE